MEVATDTQCPEWRELAEPPYSYFPIRNIYL